MTTRTLYLVRHGERLDAFNKNWYDSEDNKHDTPLSDKGQMQAQRLAQRLQQEVIDRIFVSPYLRALQTAQPVAEALNMPLYVEAGIGEWLGRSMLPQAPNIAAPQTRMEEFPCIDLRHESFVIPNWPETVSQVFERYEKAVQQLLTHYDGNLLLVGHGRTVTGIAHRLTGKREFEFKYELAGLTKLVLEDGTWQVRLNGDTTHLTAETVPQYV